MNKCAYIEPGSLAADARKRVIMSMGGKGGVGKTSIMTGLAEWFDSNQIPITLLDLDTENKARGSLTHFFSGRVPKVNIHTPAGLDAFVDRLSDGVPVVLADMGAGSGQITYDWFEKMYPDVADAGIVFTAIGVVTSDPASVERERADLWGLFSSRPSSVPPVRRKTNALHAISLSSRFFLI